MGSKRRMRVAAMWIALCLGAFLLLPRGGTAGSSGPDGDELPEASETAVPADRDELPSETDCANGIDDSGDGLVDCEDPACQARPCEDANACTTGDTCSSSACVGQPVSCDDDNECTIDICNAGFCQYSPNDGALCDGETGLCSSGQCGPGAN